MTKACWCALPSVMGPQVCENCPNRFENEYPAEYPYETTPRYPFDVPNIPVNPEPKVNINFDINAWQIATLIETIQILNERIKELEEKLKEKEKQYENGY